MTLLLDRVRAALSDRYAVENEIGRGGMATVYSAREPRHDRRVAIKVLHPEFAAAIGSERFSREIQTAAKLNHSHILPLLDSGEADGLFYYVMPLMSGDSLRERLRRERELPVPEALRIASQIAAGLSHAHRQGIIHRDIKPENILFQDGEVLIADFGIARAIADDSERLTKTGFSIGTPQYMSPEQATADRLTDARTDVYALGCVLYEMLAGEPPHSGATAQAVLVKKMTERPVPLRLHRRSIPEAVDEAVRRALSKLPADRFASVEEFAGALDRASGGTSRVAMWRIAAGATATIALVAIGAGAWTIHSNTSRSSESAHLRQATFTGEAEDASLSPDGKTIAYVADRATRLMLQDVASGAQTTILRDTAGIVSPRWSPSGSRLLYVRGHENNMTNILSLHAIDRFGGQRTNLSLPAGLEMATARSFDFGETDSVIVVGFTSNDQENLWVFVGSSPSSLQQHSPDSVTGSGLVLRLRGPPDVLWSVRLSPDGKRVAFAGTKGSRVILGTIPLDGGAATLVSDSAYVADYIIGLEWAPSGDGFYYPWAEGNVGAVMYQRLDRNSGKPLGLPDRVLGSIARPGTLGLSADGKRLVISSGADFAHLELVSLGAHDRAADRQPISCGTGSCFRGTISPDGRSIAFKRQTSSTTTAELIIRSIADGTERRLSDASSPVYNAAWSPDGRRIAYTTGLGDSSKLIIEDLTSGVRLEAFRGRIREPAWSPDGVHIAFPSSGTLVLLTNSVVTKIPGEPVAIFFPPVFTPDGKRVAVRLEGAEGGLYLIDLADGSRTRVMHEKVIPVRWAGAKTLYVIRTDSISGDAISIESLALDSRAFNTISRFPKSSSTFSCGTGLTLSLDMRTAVCNAWESRTDVWMVDGFDRTR